MAVTVVTRKILEAKNNKEWAEAMAEQDEWEFVAAGGNWWSDATRERRIAEFFEWAERHDAISRRAEAQQAMFHWHRV